MKRLALRTASAIAMAALLIQPVLAQDIVVALSEVELRDDGSVLVPDGAHPILKTFLENNLAQTKESECSQVRGPMLTVGAQRETGSLQALREQSEGFYAGEVVSADAVFYMQIFGTMLEVAVEETEVRAGTSSFATSPGRLRLFYPKVRANFGKKCLEVVNTGIPDPPRVGDRLLYVALHSGELDDRVGVAFPFWDTVFVERAAREGVLEPATRWLGPTGVDMRQSVDDLVGSIRTGDGGQR